MFKGHPDFAVACLNAALANYELPDGPATLLTVLRQIALEQGLEAVAERAGMSKMRLCQTLQRKGSPSLKTFMTVIHGIGLRLEVRHAAQYVQECPLVPSTMFEPPHPGITLREDVLPALGLNCAEAAKQLDVPADTLNLVLNGHVTITPEMALRIEAWLGAANGAVAQLWLSQQSAYDSWQNKNRCKTNSGQAQ